MLEGNFVCGFKILDKVIGEEKTREEKAEGWASGPPTELREAEATKD